MEVDEIEIGMIVDYHMVIGGRITKPGCKITSLPWKVSGGIPIVKIDKMSGGVSLEAITHPVITNRFEPCNEYNPCNQCSWLDKIECTEFPCIKCCHNTIAEADNTEDTPTHDTPTHDTP